MTCWHTLAGLLVAATCLHAQESPAPIIRSETRTVLVDALAVDKKGKFATDLAQKDFRIWEDGKEQKLTGFSLESSGVSPERPARHYIVMFFDTSTGTPSSQVNVRQEALRFVDGFATPDRYMAVIDYNFDSGVRIPQNLKAKRDLLKKALSAVPQLSGSTQASTQLRSPRTRGGRGNAANTSADTFAYRNMLQSLRSVVASLANIRGRKALVLFTGGIPATCPRSALRNSKPRSRRLQQSQRGDLHGGPGPIRQQRERAPGRQRRPPPTRRSDAGA